MNHRMLERSMNDTTIRYATRSIRSARRNMKVNIVFMVWMAGFGTYDFVAAIVADRPYYMVFSALMFSVGALYMFTFRRYIEMIYDNEIRIARLTRRNEEIDEEMKKANDPFTQIVEGFNAVGDAALPEKDN